MVGGGGVRNLSSNDARGARDLPDELRSAIARARKSQLAGRSDQAVRDIDRAMRRMPEYATTIAPIYGDLLVDLGDLESALRAYTLAAEASPSADFEANVVSCLNLLRRELPLARRLEYALQRHSVTNNGALASAAHGVLEGATKSIVGWVGLSPKLELVGEFVGGDFSRRVTFESAGGDLLGEIQMPVQKSATSAFCIRPDQIGFWRTRQEKGRQNAQNSPRKRPDELTRLTSNSRPITVQVDGKPLLGSGLSWPPDFGLDGRATSKNRLILGWVSLRWDNQCPEFLCVEDEAGRFQRIRTTRDPENTNRRLFQFSPKKTGIFGRRINIFAILPGGGRELLPDGPLLLEPLPGFKLPPKSGISAGLGHPSRKNHRSVDVIVPVYRGYDESLACIHSVLRSLPSWAQLIVVDDASPDPALRDAMDQLAASGLIRLVRSETNLGFPGAVNSALMVNDQNDVILLNSDTLVCSTWLVRLRSAAYSAPNVGTVTPLTNDGTIASYPAQGGGDFGAEAVGQRDELVAKVNRGQRIEIPVGVGFCLYIRRDCLNEVGELDANTFGKGYGEETDLCMRARKRGWKHLLATDVFVAHSGGKSFGARRGALLERASRLINLRHPGYDGLIDRFIAADPVRLARRRLDEYGLTAKPEQFVLLAAIHPTGGVDRFLFEHCQKIRATGLSPIILMPLENGKIGCRLWTDDRLITDLRYDIPSELPRLLALLRKLNISRVEIHHFLGLDSRLIEGLRGLRAPYDVFIHDYIWICPRITLIDNSRRYCGEPEVARCEVCVKKNGSRLTESISVAGLRQRSAQWLSDARTVIVPTIDARRRLGRYFPKLDPIVAPWEPAVLAGRSDTPTASVTRVALIGGIGEHKGFEVLLQCAKDAVVRNLPIEFVVIGETAGDKRLQKTGRVFITGRYQESEIAALLRRERPHLAFFPSVCPETWSYTLSHAIRAGLPIVGFDLGAIGERLRSSVGSLLLPIDMKAREINDRLLLFSKSRPHTDYVRENPDIRGTLLRTIDICDTIQSSPMADDKVSSNRSKNSMAAKRKLGTLPAQAALSPEPKPTATAQIMLLQEGQYSFSVTATKPSVGSLGEHLPPPAMQVSVGPGLQPGQIELLSYPKNPGAWLCALGDTLVAKVNAGGGAFVLTSVRTPGGSTLSIDVRRLESAARNEIAGKSEPVSSSEQPIKASRVQIVAHIRNRGDLTFVDQPWAGRAGKGLWIEAFSIAPLEGITPQLIEYKALTASGFETPWISDGASCGTRGMSVPLIGFSVRLKSGPNTSMYDCEYSGSFQSGTTTGPFRNGAPCRSNVANDPLEGIQIRLVKRLPVGNAGESAKILQKQATPTGIGPRFSKFKEDPISITTVGKESKKDAVSAVVHKKNSESSRSAKKANAATGSKLSAKKKRF